MSPSRALLISAALFAVTGAAAFWMLREPGSAEFPASQVASVKTGAPVRTDSPAPARPAQPVVVKSVAVAAPVEIAPRVEEAVPSRVLFGNSFGREPEAKLAAFDRWAAQYAAAPVAARAAMVAEGAQLAAARRPVMAQLIHDDPRQAIASTIPMAVRQVLPGAVLTQVEERVDAKGTLAQNGVLGLPGEAVATPVYRTAALDGKEYRTSVYGARTTQATRTNVALHGIALEGALAVSDSPVRLIEQGETVPAGLVASPTCPVSGQVTGQGGTESASAINVGDKIETLCHLDHAIKRENDLQTAEDAASPTEEQKELAWDVAADGKPGASGVSGRPTVAWSTGTKKLLIIRVDFSDLAGDPKSGSSTVTPDYLENLVNNTTTGIAAFYNQGSYGLTTLSFNKATDTNAVTYRMPQTAAYYAKGNGSDAYNYTLHQDAEKAATSAGYNLANYDRIGVVFSWLGSISGSFINYGGLGEIQGKNFWANGEVDFRVCAHELGHTYGLQHCNLWQIPTTSKNPIDPTGSSTEYGDPFGVMGGGSTNINYQFDPWQKTILHWLPDNSVPAIKTSGVQRIYRFDHPNADTANHVMGIKVAHSSSTDYWISYRQLFPSNTSLSNGAYIIWGYNSVVQGNLLDFTTPGTNPQDAALAIGTSFRDPASNVTLKPLAKGGTTPNEYLDVQVDYDPHIQWLTPTFAADQQSGGAQVTLIRTGSTAAAVSVHYATADGTATAPAAYAATSGTVSWAANDGTPKTVTIPLVATGSASIRSFTVTMDTPTGGALLDAPLAAQVNIGSSGMLDSSFVAQNFSNAVTKMVRQPDGKLLVAGNFGAQVGGNGAGYTRLNADGTVDSTFYNAAGANVVPVKGLALQPDGKVLIGGAFTAVNGIARNHLARLNADGTLDTSFAPGIGADATVNSIAVQPDGQILIAGSFASYSGTTREGIARLNPDASLDTTFAGPDFAGSTARINVVTLQPDNKVLIAGAFTFTGNQVRSGLARLNADGSVDAAFNTGLGAHDVNNPSAPLEVFTLALQTDGAIVIGGNFTGFSGTARNYLARVSSTGVLTAFNPAASSVVQSVALQPDGKVLVGGSFSTIAGAPNTRFARLNADGTADSTFITGAGSPTSVNDWSLQPDGSVLIATNHLNGATTQQLFRVFAGLANKVSTVQLTAATATGTEGQTLNLTVARTGGSTGAVSVNYAVQLLTAASSRVGPAAGTLTWADGDSTPRTIPVTLIRDAVAQTVQTFAVNLGAYSGGVIAGAPMQEVVTITADSSDVIAPALTVNTPADNTVVVSPSLTVSGTASDSGKGNNGASVKVNGVAAGSALGAATANWTATVTLTPGANLVKVVALDSVSNAATQTLNVSYYNTPTISTQPEGTTVLTGTSVTLSVGLISSGSSSSIVGYQWYIGETGDQSHPVAGATSATFVTPALTATTWFWVQITNSNQATTNSYTAVVNVAATPAIAHQPVDTTINTGQTASLSVLAGASGSSNPDVTYQWYQGTSGDISRPTTTTTANFTSAPLTANASFWVRLTNSAGFSTDSNAAQVLVNVPPAFGAQPGSARINPGQSATLTVTASGSGMASDASVFYQWYEGVSGDTGKPAASTATSLTTPALTASTSYWVQLRNSAGLTANSATASIVVNSPPAIRTAPHNLNVSAGKTATLQVIAGASGTDLPTIDYAWFEGASGVTTKPVGTDQPTFTTPVMDIGSVQYWVRLTNSQGLFTNSATITVKVTSAPRITTQPVGGSIVTGTRFILSVVAESGTVDPALHYKWYKGRSGDVTTPVLDAEDASRCDSGLITTDTNFWVRVTNGTSATSLSTDSSTAMVRVFNTALANLAPMPNSARWTDALVVSANPYGTADDSVLLSSRSYFVGVSYKNIGIAASKAFKGTVTLQPGNKVIAFTQTVPIAPNGAGQQLALRTLLLGRLAAGEYTLTLKLDSDKTLTESIESDNSYTRHFVVTDPPMVAATRLLPPLRVHGSASMVGGSAGVDLYWAKGDIYQNSWTVFRRNVVGRAWTPWAQVGTSAAPVFRDGTIAAATTYQYYVTASVGTKVSAPAVSGLIVAPAVVNAQSVVELTPVSFATAMTAGATADAPLDNTADVLTNLTILNSGTAPTPATGFSVNFTIDDHTTITASTKLIVPAAGTLVLPDVNLGRLAPGTHTVVAHLDPDGVLDEPLRTNNSLSTQLTVKAVNAELDGFVDTAQGQTSALLVATQPKATTPATTITSTDHVYASISVANNGTDLLPTQNFNLGIYLDGKLITTKPITPGSDSAWKVQDVDLGLLALGYHTLAVRIDDSDDATEGNEANNLLSMRLPLVTRPVPVRR